MRWTGAIVGMVMLIAVACGSDRGGPAAGGEGSPSSSVASPTSTATAITSSSPTVTSTEDPDATPTPAARLPTPAPTLTPTPFSPLADATIGPCTSVAEPAHERVEEWPDFSEFVDILIGAFPWDVLGIPDDPPIDPEFHLSHGIEAPEHITGDGPVTFAFTLYNRYDETIAFPVLGEPAYDFAVISAEGEVVWMYSDDVDVEPGERFIELEPDEKREATATWDLTGPGGERVKDGQYFLVSILWREEPQVEIDEQFIYIGEMPSLEESLELQLSAPSEVKCGEAITLTLEVTNATDVPVRVATGQDVDNYYAFATDEAGERGEEVWNWWAVQQFMQDFGLSPYLPPGATATFTRSWELRDVPGNHVPPGTYELQASFHGERILNTTGGDGVDEKLWSNIVEVTVRG